MLKFPPSLLAAAAIFTANCCICEVRLWNKTCGKHTNYIEDQLFHSAAMQKGVIPEGIVLLFFQPAEEGCGGGKKMTDAGALENVKAILMSMFYYDLQRFHIMYMYESMFTSIATCYQTIAGDFGACKTCLRLSRLPNFFSGGNTELHVSRAPCGYPLWLQIRYWSLVLLQIQSGCCVFEIASHRPPFRAFRINISEIKNHEWFLMNLPADLGDNAMNNRYEESGKPSQCRAGKRERRSNS